MARRADPGSPAPVRTHRYAARIEWTGNDGTGTRDYRSYRRDHVIQSPGKPELAGSADPVFRGDAGRYNPEELLVASLSACHMLWYLHLCASGGVVVTDYRDDAEGSMDESPDGSGRFSLVTLHPRVRISAGNPSRALELHEAAHRHCFIANSVNFPVRCEPTVEVEGQTKV